MSDRDDRPVVLGVHWNTDDYTARRQFDDWGFKGIADFTKEAVLNGNEARSKARQDAMDQGIHWFFCGAYDWNLTVDSAIYRFRYDTYIGPDGWLWNGAGAKA